MGLGFFCDFARVAKLMGSLYYFLFEGLIIQQLKFSLNRQINFYVSKRFPPGIT